MIYKLSKTPLQNLYLKLFYFNQFKLLALGILQVLTFSCVMKTFIFRSYGITFWEIMTFGSMPYTGMTNKETMNYVMRGGRLSRPGICPEPVYKLMGSCWKTNPQTRPTFEYIRNKLRLFIQVSSFHTIAPCINYRHNIYHERFRAQGKFTCTVNLLFSVKNSTKYV